MQWPIRLLLSFGLALAVMGSAIANDYCCGNVNYRGIRIQPSNARLKRKIVNPVPQGCVSIYTGHWLNCSFDFKILGLADVLPSHGFLPSGYPEELITGGHNHGNDRPFVFPNNETGLLSIDNGTIFQQTGLEITGQTDRQDTHVLYPIPEEGGIIAVQDDMYTPPDWFCAYYCFSPKDFRWQEDFEIGYFDPVYTNTQLVRLPEEGDDYVVVDHDGITHSDSTGYAYGTYLRPEAKQLLLEIARQYHNKTGAKLSLNDMSLPLGGLFDFLHDDWQPPHKGHRDGIAVDINHLDSNGNYINCSPLNHNDFSDSLQYIANRAIKKANDGELHFKPYVCETWNHNDIHINLFNPFNPPSA